MKQIKLIKESADLIASGLSLFSRLFSFLLPSWSSLILTLFLPPPTFFFLIHSNFGVPGPETFAKVKK